MSKCETDEILTQKRKPVAWSWFDRRTVRLIPQTSQILLGLVSICETLFRHVRKMSEYLFSD